MIKPKRQKHHWIKANICQDKRDKARESLVERLKSIVKKEKILKITSLLGIQPLDCTPPIVEEINRVVKENRDSIANNHSELGRGILLFQVNLNEQLQIISKTNYLQLNEIASKKLTKQTKNTYFLDCLLFEIASSYDSEFEIPVIVADSIGLNFPGELCIYLFQHKFKTRSTDAI